MTWLTWRSLVPPWHRPNRRSRIRAFACLRCGAQAKGNLRATTNQTKPNQPLPSPSTLISQHTYLPEDHHQLPPLTTTTTTTTTTATTTTTTYPPTTSAPQNPVPPNFNPTYTTLRTSLSTPPLNTLSLLTETSSPHTITTEAAPP